MYRDDDRGQSIQIGAVLLFGALIIALAGYQAFVVPQQNEAVEFSHSQTVQNDMQDLRNALVSATGDASAQSVSVKLGTRYPDRIFAVNPGPASGSLRTVGSSDPGVAIAIKNATATSETGDFWNGTTRNYSTGFVTYRPNYNRYRSAPTTTYEHSALGNDFDTGAVALAEPSFVDGRTITLVALNGSLSTTRVGATSVDVRPVSASTRTVSVTNASGSNVTLELPTRFSESFWRDALSDQMAPDGYVESVDVTSGSPYDTLVVELTPGENYTLRLAKAGVGAGVAETDPSYLTDVSGNGSAVPEEGSQQVVVEVRDAYNNPVSGVTVNGSAAGGSLADTTVTTDENGRATFQYEAPTVDEETAVALNFSYTVDPGSTPTFDGEPPDNVELTVNVQNTETTGAAGGGGSASYALDWESPTASEGGSYLDNCDDDNCTWDVGADSDDTLDLTAGTDPEIEGVDLDFALNNSTVGTLSPDVSTTDSNGEGSTTLTASENGTVKLYVFGPGGASDAINITVTNVTGGASNADTTSPTFDLAEAKSRDTDNNKNDVEQVNFTAEVSDNVGVDRVEAKVFDEDSNLIGSRTFQSGSFSSQSVTLDDSVNLNNKNITVELIAYDTSGNSRTCTGRIDNVSEQITKSGGGLSCTQTSTAAAPLVGPWSGPGGNGGIGGVAVVVGVLGIVLLVSRVRGAGRPSRVVS